MIIPSNQVCCYDTLKLNFQELFKPGRLSQSNLYWKQNLVRAAATLFGLMLAVSAVIFHSLFRV